MTSYKSYDTYRETRIKQLSEEIRKEGNFIMYGKWRDEVRKEYKHILPILGKNTRESRINALKDYLDVTIKECFITKKSKGRKEPLHPNVHHVNSSQLLCYMVFSEMLNEDLTPTDTLIDFLAALGLNITSKARCSFEYHDNWRWKEECEPEGTSFDFHIHDGENEYFFEIKFTENGFGKAPNDDRHRQKIQEIYLPKMVSKYNLLPTVENIQKNYQIFRNILRSDSPNKKVIFITDGKNVATNKALGAFKKDFPGFCHDGVIFKSWQEVCAKWPKNLAKPFQFVCFEE